MHKLVYPSKNGGQFKLEEIKKYKNEEYHANSWSVKITSNGRYLLAPTIYGQMFVFNMLTGEVSAIIKEHQGTSSKKRLSIFILILTELF